VDEGRLLFEESMSDLSGRFREVHVTVGREATAPMHAPRNWLHVRAAGSVLMFVDTQFSKDDLAERIGSLVGDVRGIDAQPMGLRSIFTTLARAARDGANL
jgi:hypothetical protein